MSEQALRARDRVAEGLREELARAVSELQSLQDEKNRVEGAESVAVEETHQLSSLVQQLHAEKAAMTAAMQKLQRERQYLTEENALLRNQLSHAVAEHANADLDLGLSPLGPPPSLLASLQDSLGQEQDRAVQAENDNMLLRARVAALEKSSKALQSALVGCIEEGERSRIVAGLDAGFSPLAVLSPSRWRSDVTEEETARSEAGSSSCTRGYATPVARSLGSDLGCSPVATLLRPRS